MLAPVLTLVLIAYGAVDPDASSDAEQVAALQRTIEADAQSLEQCDGQTCDNEIAFKQAESLFREIDEHYVAAHRADGVRPKLEPEQLDRLTRVRVLVRERFDLAIQERQALKRRHAVLVSKLARERAALARLTGDEPVPPTTEPESATVPAPRPIRPTHATTALGIINPKATLPLVDATTATELTAELLSPSLRRAHAEIRSRSQQTRRAENDLLELNARLTLLNETLAEARTLRETAQRQAENAREALAYIDHIHRENSRRNASADQVARIKHWRETVADWLQVAERDLQGRAARLAQLEEEHSGLTAECEASRLNVDQARGRLRAADSAMAWLLSPMNPRNILQWLENHAPRVAMIVLAMLLGQFFARRGSRKIIHLIAQHGREGTAEERAARAETLVGFFRSAATLAIVGGGGLLTCQEVGLPIIPLMGGAAVVGLAVAFGAQSLIKDYFYGFVILMENQYKLNDMVKIGDLAGVVERITLRITVLRDHEARVHFIPNGAISAVTNLSHGYSRAVFDIGVAYNEDVDRVMDVLNELGRDLRADPKFGSLLLDDLVMLGVNELADSAVILRCHFKTKPLQQFPIRREFLRRVKQRFDELGIDIPFPQRTVHHRVESPDQVEPASLVRGPHFQVHSSNPA